MNRILPHVNLNTKELPRKCINKFTKEEDEKLLSLVIKYKEKNWKKISSYFKNKNYIQCFSRFKRIRPGIKRGFWNKEEDELVLYYVKKFGKKWAQIAKEIKTRNSKQIRDRFINILDPALNRGIFTKEEDSLIIKLYHMHGPKWSKIALECKTKRSPDLVKNRFYSHLKGTLTRNSSLDTVSDNPKKDDEMINSEEFIDLFGSVENTHCENSLSKEIDLNEISEIYYNKENFVCNDLCLFERNPA